MRFVQAVGGFAGDGGGAGGFVAFGGSSESAGDGGTVLVTLTSGTRLQTAGDHAYALQAQSVGGGGGRGGASAVPSGAWAVTVLPVALAARSA